MRWLFVKTVHFQSLIFNTGHCLTLPDRTGGIITKTAGETKIVAQKERLMIQRSGEKKKDDNVKQISQSHGEVGWQKPISSASSWGNNALDKRSAQLGQDDSHPSRQLSKSLRRRRCCSPKTWLIDVRCRMQIDLQLSCAPQIRRRKTSAVTRQRRAEIIALSPVMAAGVEAAKQSSQLIAA